MSHEIKHDMTIGGIATEFPELIPGLERLGIDYCCGGGRSLGDVAAEMGLTAADVVARLSEPVTGLAAASEREDFAAMSMTELADHIERTHHVFARDALAQLGRLIAKCVAAHGDEEPRLMELQRTLAALDEDMRDHLVREERVLFPWLRRLENKSEITSGPPWSVRRPIDCMIHDHDDVGEAFRRIHELTDDLTPPDDACSTWKSCFRLLGDLEMDTHRHIHKENNILFPAGVAAEERKRSGEPALRAR